MTDDAKAKTKAVPPRKSAHHVCFARRLADGSVVAIAAEAAKPDDFEFFTNKLAGAMWRARISDKLRLVKRPFWGWVRYVPSTEVVTTGAYRIKDACAQLGCAANAEVLDAIARWEQHVADNYVTGNSTEVWHAGLAARRAGKASGSMAKSKTGGMTLSDAWAALLIENEALAAKRGGKPLTDEQLVTAMEKEFPDKKGKSTLTRVSMVRGCYNKGTNMFAKGGKAGTAARPTSFRYDETGAKVEPRSNSTAAGGVTATKPAKATKPVAAEKPAPAKKVAKKATKAAVTST